MGLDDNGHITVEYVSVEETREEVVVSVPQDDKTQTWPARRHDPEYEARRRALIDRALLQHASDVEAKSTGLAVAQRAKVASHKATLNARRRENARQLLQEMRSTESSQKPPPASILADAHTKGAVELEEPSRRKRRDRIKKRQTTLLNERRAELQQRRLKLGQQEE